MYIQPINKAGVPNTSQEQGDGSPETPARLTQEASGSSSQETPPCKVNHLPNGLYSELGRDIWGGIH